MRTLGSIAISNMLENGLTDSQGRQVKIQRRVPQAASQTHVAQTHNTLTHDTTYRQRQCGAG